MRFDTRQRQSYCGIDLHARSIYVCIMDQADVVVAVECIFTWYWIAESFADPLVLPLPSWRLGPSIRS